MSTNTKIIKPGSEVELRVYVSSDDYSTISSMAHEMKIDVETLAAQALQFYFPLVHTLDTYDYVIQHGPDIRHAVPYTLPATPPEAYEGAARLYSLSPDERQAAGSGKGDREKRFLRLMVTDKAWKQLHGITHNAGQFLLDGIQCYFDLTQSWRDGNRIFLEKDELIETEIDMEAFIVSHERARPEPQLMAGAVAH